MVAGVCPWLTPALWSSMGSSYQGLQRLGGRDTGPRGWAIVSDFGATLGGMGGRLAKPLLCPLYLALAPLGHMENSLLLTPPLGGHFCVPVRTPHIAEWSWGPCQVSAGPTVPKICVSTQI